MILTDNISYLKKLAPSVWDRLYQFEQQFDWVNDIELIQSKIGLPTLTKKNSQGLTTFIHSKYDPLQEAEQIIDQYRNEITQYQHVVFFGVGLGYHIEVFTKRYPNITFSICEPNKEILYQYLSNKKLDDFSSGSLKDIYLVENEQESLVCVSSILKIAAKKTLVIILPSYRRLFREEFSYFENNFSKSIINKKSEMRINIAFEKRWIINGINNLYNVLTSSDILHVDSKLFKNKPVLIVAAGPSLEEEIENIRYVKENKLAYIFSIGSAINALLSNDIIPDAVCTYDPSELNQVVFANLIERGLDNIPMIFGSTVAYEILQKYLGPKYHMLINQDLIAYHYLKRNDGEPLIFLNDAPTIAVVTLQLLAKLGANPVVLVGQNLAYRDNQYYAKGIDYDHIPTSRNSDKNLVKVKDIEGNEIFTSHGLNSMRLQIENCIRSNGMKNVINTTVGGAEIAGTNYIPMKNVINEILVNQVVESNWEHHVSSRGYDISYALTQSQVMEQEKEKFKIIVFEFRKILSDISRQAEMKNRKRLNKLFNKFDDKFTRLQNNKFYLHMINRMSRVHFEVVMSMFQEIRYQKDEITKAQRVVDEFGSYLDHCLLNTAIVEPLMNELHGKIKLLYNKNLGDK
ncbi:6-hydroxymethylpterin diphosphokinase MptE-like protein [Brevibacillus sp. AY1]|uniref:motility associated factor glycosyltransferase family protein n=1 Tax=Brevibacillus sp. AY1 TaxID=2807621 RepID=UPI00245384D7|nr:6-hydroxymethylpterin diphosphokinase MptE-like protein [Brevibacillus sp. AY1]MDH4618256.1 motility associated factor glycosyltransferase family protein [Brevibacillus sp. AY1]